MNTKATKTANRNLDLGIRLAVGAQLAAASVAKAADDRGDSGQGVLEYAGVLLLVAAIVVGMIKLNISGLIKPIIQGAINDVKAA